MSVPLPASVPARFSCVMVSLPPSASVAPLSTLTVAPPASRPAPTSVSVSATVMPVAAAVPASVLLPLLSSVPVPRFAPAATVPLLSV